MASNSWRQPLSIPAPEERGSLVEGEAKAKRKKACKTLKNYAKFVKRKILQKAVSRNPLSISKLNDFDGLGSNTKYLEVCKHQILLLKTSL